MKSLLVLFLVAASASSLAAQQSLTTTFANNNGGSVGGAIYFDLTAGAGGVAITDLDLNFGSVAGTAGSIDIYTIPAGGTFAGNEGNAAAWGAVVTSALATAAGVGNPTNCVLATPIAIPANERWGFAIAAVGLSHSYTTGTAPFPVQYSGCDLSLDAGSASNVPFVGSIFNPRVANVTINYVSGSICCAGLQTVGTGCTPGAPLTLTGIGRPIMDAAGSVVYTVTASNIDAAALFHMNILSQSVLPGGVNLSGTDASCFLYAAPQFFGPISVVVGIPSLTFPLINLPQASATFCGFEFYSQSATLDLSLISTTTRVSNALRLTLGDA